ncbi:WD40/YVTN/BNR-like repeat-containing protein [Lapillicoccus jejuensis]|uniref:Photosystem II stability/assembly factor-like uncharacterized protein n=1 Tax=Lapillicoccus jejuensis TaxID=402171 RepID=A0A542DXW2_9MICO|nr:oxidoreductase [Lapillicoccus jejuensis]TQJ07932.1 photosystem II stability/assembly factor-like uncharacterized protein [Lapillicoccus jejuensis]
MSRRRLLPVLAAAALAATAAVTAAPAATAEAASSTAAASPAVRLAWTLLPTGSTEHFRGLAAVSDRVAWVAGYDGTVLRTTDGGEHWASVGPKLSQANAALQFRDIEAFSADDAVVLSIGNGTDSRIYRTSDGGASWTATFVNHDEAAFYDCLAFSDPMHGVANSDPVDGRFRIVATDDGGRTWTRVPAAGMPPVQEGEAAFAASGQCLAAGTGDRFYLGSGGVPGTKARVFRSDDGGRTWDVASTPIRSGSSNGVNGIAFSSAKDGIAVGGSFVRSDLNGGASAWTTDGGATWQRPTVPTGGYRSGVSFAPGLAGVAVAVGLTGSDVTTDSGRTWETFDTGSFDTVSCTSGLVCWASGAEGRVARLTLAAG